MLKTLIVVALIAGAAYVTKPDEADAEAALRERLILALATEDLSSGRSAGQKLALAACKLDISTCYDLLRSEIATVYSDFGVASRVEMAGLGRTATCYGVFTRFFCPGGLKDA